MAQQIINVGTNPNDGTGDTLRGAFIKTDDNFTELYSGKQNTLVSGTNIKTINGNSVLGSGDLTISGGVSGSGTTNYVSKFTSSGAIGNSKIFDDGTNIGINTTSPTRALHVVGITTATIVASYYNSNAICYTGYHSTGTTENAVRVGAQGNNLLFSVSPDGSPAERMRITSSGDVGIGTSTPFAKLHIEGSLYAYDTNSFELNNTYIKASDGSNGFILESGFTRIGNTLGSSDFTGVEIDGNISVFKAVNTGVNYKFGMKTNENSLYTTENMLSNTGPSDISNVYKWLRLTDENDNVFYFPLYA